MIVGSTSKQIDLGRSFTKNFSFSVKQKSTNVSAIWVVSVTTALFDRNGLLLISKVLQSSFYFAGLSISQWSSKVVFPFSNILLNFSLVFLKG